MIFEDDDNFDDYENYDDDNFEYPDYQEGEIIEEDV